MPHEHTTFDLEEAKIDSRRPLRVPIVGPLRVHERFSVGALAALHFGWSTTSHRLVAVKKVHPHLTDDVTFTKLLVEEAKASMQLRHLNVVALVAVVTSGDDLLLASEWVPGASLSEILVARRPLPLDCAHATALASSTLHGLHYAHQARGVLHRGISAETVLLGDDGIARILGFGLARAKARLQSLREPIVKWKLAYVPPEELLGDRVDARSDVYATSAVLWEALSGRPLFQGPTVDATLRKILFEPVPAPSNSMASIPPALEAIVLRGLARDPTQRFATAIEMARALEAIDLAASPRALAEHLAALNLRHANARSWGANQVAHANLR